MKKSVVIFSLGVVTGCALLSGCSKSKNTATQSANSANSSATAAAPAGPLDMKIKWAVGKKYSMKMEFNQSTKTDVPNQPQPVTQEVKLDQNYDISVLKELDNGGRELELEFENETMDVLQGGRSVMSFDSAQSSAEDTNNPAAPILRAMIGARIQYFTDANGKVEKMEGVDELMNRIDAIGNPQQQANFKQMFSEDTLKRYCSFAEALPDHAVNIGDSWHLKKDVPSTIGVLAVDVKYTFKNWEQHDDRKCAHIEDTGEISSKSVSAAMTGAVVEIEKGKTSGDFWFDPELGMIVDVNTDQEMPMKITTRAQTMTSHLSQKIRVTLVDVTP
ncbi:MAG: DUF6263 family protein [Limisphaerales bacterium]